LTDVLEKKMAEAGPSGMSSGGGGGRLMIMDVVEGQGASTSTAAVASSSSSTDGVVIENRVAPALSSVSSIVDIMDISDDDDDEEITTTTGSSSSAINSLMQARIRALAIADEDAFLSQMIGTPSPTSRLMLEGPPPAGSAAAAADREDDDSEDEEYDSLLQRLTAEKIRVLNQNGEMKVFRVRPAVNRWICKTAAATPVEKIGSSVVLASKNAEVMGLIDEAKKMRDTRRASPFPRKISAEEKGKVKKALELDPHCLGAFFGLLDILSDRKGVMSEDFKATCRLVQCSL
jgi:hypothetical protein